MTRVPKPVAGAHGGSTLAQLEGAELDVLVVGGGITGACVAWHAAQRGLRTVLVERDDFGAGATANCLKIVHGGLRYLQHLDLRRMRESIIERSAWLRAAPHLVEPLPVVMPTWRKRFPPRSLLAGALAVNELVSLDRNRDMPGGQTIPRARVISRRECLALVPELDVQDLTGGILFYDAIMYSPERLVFEIIAAARAAGAIVANHTEFVAAITDAGRVTAVKLHDRLTAENTEVRTRWIVNATGRFADTVAARLVGRQPAQPQQYSIALNFVTRQPARAVAFTLTGGAAVTDRGGGGGARQLFVVPWRNQTLIGTAHLPYRGDPAAFELRDEHVSAFLTELATASPSLRLNPDEVALVHHGLLPVADETGASGVGTAAVGVDRGGIRLLKRHRVIDHAGDGVIGALSVVSVKFTTAQVIARDVVARIAGGRFRSVPAPSLRLPGAAFESLEVLQGQARAECDNTLPPDVLEHVVRSYGARCIDVLSYRTRVAGWDRRVIPGAPVIRAQLLYGAAAEMARTADDLLWRRTEIGPRGLVNEAAYREAEQALADARGGTVVGDATAHPSG